MSQPNEDRLDSWKEIAAYLGRDVRTVRRWEKERRLPVHRVPGGERGAVFAYRTEVDVWLKGAEEDRTNGEPNLPAPASSDPKVIGSADSQSVGASAHLSSVRVWPKGRWMALAVLCSLAVGGYWLWENFYGGPVAQASFSGNTLVAQNKKGAVLWRFDFDQPLEANPDNPRQRIVIADLGHGRKGDVLVAVPFSSSDRANTSSDALYCISGHGKLRWRHTFDDTPRFGGHDYPPPWIVSGPLVISDGDSPLIWASAREAYSSTSTLVELDPDGRQLARFVNWGHIATVSRVRNASGSFILAGGISNQCNCAMLAVLREENPSGTSPVLDPGYECENCPQGKPYRYFLFPRSELTLLSGVAYNNLHFIHSDERNTWVGVKETSLGEPPLGADWIKYDLSDNFVPQSFTVSDHFWVLHRQFEGDGKLHHTAAQCPERSQPRKVRMWTSERGWEEIAVPVSTER